MSVASSPQNNPSISFYNPFIRKYSLPWRLTMSLLFPSWLTEWLTDSFNFSSITSLSLFIFIYIHTKVTKLVEKKKIRKFLEHHHEKKNFLDSKKQNEKKEKKKIFFSSAALQLHDKQAAQRRAHNDEWKKIIWRKKNCLLTHFQFTDIFRMYFIYNFLLCEREREMERERDRNSSRGWATKQASNIRNVTEIVLWHRNKMCTECCTLHILNTEVDFMWMRKSSRMKDNRTFMQRVEG